MKTLPVRKRPPPPGFSATTLHLGSGFPSLEGCNVFRDTPGRRIFRTKAKFVPGLCHVRLGVRLVESVRILKIFRLETRPEASIQFRDDFVEGKRLAGAAIVNITAGGIRACNRERHYILHVD